EATTATQGGRTSDDEGGQNGHERPKASACHRLSPFRPGGLALEHTSAGPRLTSGPDGDWLRPAFQVHLATGLQLIDPQSNQASLLAYAIDYRLAHHELA